MTGVDYSETMLSMNPVKRKALMDAGNLAALGIECAERGLIDDKLGWNDPVGVGAFLEKICLREGIGDLFAEGTLAVAKEFGLEDVVVHAKGMAPPGYEPRKMKGMGLGFATTAGGAWEESSEGTTLWPPDEEAGGEGRETELKQAEGAQKL